MLDLARLDCTDMIDYNIDLLNSNDLSHSFFCLDKDDPTPGFLYDASTIFGASYPPVAANHASNTAPPPFASPSPTSSVKDPLLLRLLLGSHLARHLRHELEAKKGYTATVGISTNKLLSKLVGNVHKPRNQTTLLPPYEAILPQESNVTSFMDGHGIGKVPWVGFKLAQKIRARVLGRPPAFEVGLIYGGTKENVTVRDVRRFPGMGPEMLEEILSGPGSQKSIGWKVWALINGVDDGEVGKAKKIPTQISIEDSYVRLDTFEQVRKELVMLAGNLIRRMHTDLTEEELFEGSENGQTQRKWLAHPRTLRLSTRPRLPLNPDGSRARSFNRISRSTPLPTFTFSLIESVESLTEKLVVEALLPTFRKLHPEKSGWNLSLVNIAVTNMVETGAESSDSAGRDIGRMLRMQDEVLREWRVTEEEVSSELRHAMSGSGVASHTPPPVTDVREEGLQDDTWVDDGSSDGSVQVCDMCGTVIPLFAITAHERFHSMNE